MKRIKTEVRRDWPSQEETTRRQARCCQSGKEVFYAPEADLA